MIHAQLAMLTSSVDSLVHILSIGQYMNTANSLYAGGDAGHVDANAAAVDYSLTSLPQWSEDFLEAYGDAQNERSGFIEHGNGHVSRKPIMKADIATTQPHQEVDASVSSDFVGKSSCCVSCLAPLPICHCSCDVLCKACGAHIPEVLPTTSSPTTLADNFGDWVFLEEQLQACFKIVRGAFPQSYVQLLAQERCSCGDPTLSQLPEGLRQQRIAELTELCLRGIQESLRSEKASAMVEKHDAKVKEVIQAECIHIFEFVERMHLAPGSEGSDLSRPGKLQGLTKRGMAQPKSKRRK